MISVFRINECKQIHKIQGMRKIQDDSSVHTAEMCLQSMNNNNNISVLALPAYIPDLSIIELMSHDLELKILYKNERMQKLEIVN